MLQIRLTRTWKRSARYPSFPWEYRTYIQLRDGTTPLTKAVRFVAPRREVVRKLCERAGVDPVNVWDHYSDAYYAEKDRKVDMWWAHSQDWKSRRGSYAAHVIMVPPEPT